MRSKSLHNPNYLKRQSQSRRMCKYCCGNHSMSVCPYYLESTVNETNKDRKCYRCGKPNHLPTECPEYYLIEGKEINCYNCGKRHLGGKCTKTSFERILHQYNIRRRTLFNKGNSEIK